MPVSLDKNSCDVTSVMGKKAGIHDDIWKSKELRLLDLVS